jgi:hypothetical protein
MMNSPIHASSPPSRSRSLVAALRALCGSRLGLLLIAGAVTVAGLGLNWSWLVAAGIAPLLLSVLPCVAMCALGLCMTQMKGNGAAIGPGPNSAPLPDADGSRLLEAHVSGDGTFKVE